MGWTGDLPLLLCLNAKASGGVRGGTKGLVIVSKEERCLPDVLVVDKLLCR